MNGIYTTFSIISALRQGIPASQLWKYFTRIGQPLQPRLAYWLALLQQANLITSNQHPGAIFYQWLHWQPDAQILHLLEAWQAAPKNRAERQLRQRILTRLKHHQTLCPSDTPLLAGLNALGLTHQGQLTRLGQAAFNQVPFSSPIPAQPWAICQQQLFTHPPADYPLLWQLEQYISPAAPYSYPLTPAAFRQASQRGDVQKLIEILQNGLKTSLPASLRAQILNQPALNIATVTILEFSSPAELRQLRQAPALRQHFQQILSPRHASIDPQDQPRILALLKRHGIQANMPDTKEPPDNSPKKKEPPRTHFQRSGLLQPLGNDIPLIDLLQQALQQQTAIEMLYHAPVSHPAAVPAPETHRITPLIIEERGGYTYIIAYSHNRRAQRTYRLDRIEIPGTSRTN